MAKQSYPWFRQSKNAWYCTLDGKKVSLGVKGRANEAEAVKAWHRLMTDDPKPKPTPEPRAVSITVKEVVSRYLADAVSRVSAQGTMPFLERICRFFVGDKGSLKADALTPTQVETWARKPTWSNSTRHDAIGIVTTVFRWAEREGLIVRNPLVGIRKPPKASRGAKALVSADSHARLVAAAEPMFGAFLELLWLTGARPGEIASLRAEEVDFAQGLVVLTEHKMAHLGKSRCLFLNADAVAVLRRLGVKEGLFFVGEDGERLTAHAIGKRLKRLCIKAGVKHCIAYGYRHSFATTALANGIPDAQVAALLGHSGTAMLHKHYSHLTAQSQALREALGRVR